MSLRTSFPTQAGDYDGGHSDGYCYTTTFTGANLDACLRLIKQYLQDEGYGELPLPKSAEELMRFRIPTRNRQIMMFEDNGYVHNPIKILFPDNPRQTKSLTLAVYDENAENHLLRFHRRLPD